MLRRAGRWFLGFTVVGLALPYAAKVVEAAGMKVGRVDSVRGGAPEAGVVIATRRTS